MTKDEIRMTTGCRNSGRTGLDKTPHPNPLPEGEGTMLPPAALARPPARRNRVVFVKKITIVVDIVKKFTYYVLSSRLEAIWR